MFAKYFFGDKITYHNIGWSCSMCATVVKCIQNFDQKTKGKDSLEELSTDTIILKLKLQDRVEGCGLG